MGNNKVIIRSIQPLVYEFTHPGDEHARGARLLPNLYIKGWKNLASRKDYY